MKGSIATFWTIGLLAAGPAWPVEVAPRISDREIIEALTELKVGQKALEEKMEQRFTAIDQRFAAIDQRFAAIDQRFTTLESNLNQRFGFLENLILVLIAGVFGLIGFVVWDRYTTLRPLDLRLRRIEEDLERDLELKGPEGSRLTRLVHALRELAKTDERIAAVLKNLSLL